jgi:hypothetical protein
MSAPERKPFLLRIPPELWQEIEKWAADDLRSVNGQIEFILRQAVARRKSQPVKDPGETQPPAQT